LRVRKNNEAKSSKKTQELESKNETKNSIDGSLSFFFFESKKKQISLQVNKKKENSSEKRQIYTQKNDVERPPPSPPPRRRRRRRRSSSSFGGGVRENVATGVRDADEEICGRVFSRRERRSFEEWYSFF
jgi:hypothetical protein